MTAASPRRIRRPYSFRATPRRRSGVRVREEPDPGHLRAAHLAQPGAGDRARPRSSGPGPNRARTSSRPGVSSRTSSDRDLELCPVLDHVVQPPPQALVAPVAGPVQHGPQRHQLHVRLQRGKHSVHIAAVQRRDARRMVSTSVADIVSRSPVSRFRSRLERCRGVAQRPTRRYDEQCAAEAAGTRRLSSRDMRVEPVRMRVRKPVNCYPSQAPSEWDPGDSVTWGCGRDAGIFNLERHRVTKASRTDSGSPRASSANRLQAHGKSLYQGDSKLHVRGVTYGTFRPDEETQRLPEPRGGRRGLRRHGRERRQLPCAPTRSRRAGCSTWRSEHGLCVMVGLPWEEHVTFLDDRERDRRDRGARARDACAPAPAIRRSSATRSATRSRPRSCAGTAAAGSSAS